MSYTPNVPLANQTIAETTDPIRNNFTFINTDLQVEHSFNGNMPGVAEGVHKQVSMPNMADPTPGSLPTGTNGLFYVNGGGPKYFNNTDSFTIQTTPLFQNVLFGSVTLSSAGVSTVASIPAYSMGYFFISPQSPSAINNAAAMGMITSYASTTELAVLKSTGMLVLNSGLFISAQVSSSSRNGIYNFVLVYFTP